MESTNKSILKSEALPGLLLLAITLLALLIANTTLNDFYHYILHDLKIFGSFNLHMFINDFLMSIFFLVVGCEIKRELLYGKLSSLKEVGFPVLAAIGGMVFPAIIFTLFNFKSGFQVGVGIPLSTDIAFAIGIFCLFESKLNSSLKLFLLTLAVVDDLLSIVIIGVFYTSNIKILGVVIALILTLILYSVKFVNKKNSLIPYIILGLLLWFAMFYSGIHSTLSGVILAFTIPALPDKEKDRDLNYKIQHKLEGFSNFVVLPLFAFANTGISLSGNLDLEKDYPLMLGIIFGLVIGKPLGIVSLGYLGNLTGAIEKPKGTSWYEVLEVSILAGIGFTMSLFVSEIAFEGEDIELSAAKISVLISALISIILVIIVTSLKNRFINKKLK